MTRTKPTLTRRPAQKAPPAPSRKTRPPRERMARRRVTFRLPKEAAPEAGHVVVAGSFNDWSLDLHPLVRSANGDFQLELELESGEHEFRFLIDGVRWENAWDADKYVWNEHAQCENSVIVVS